ncbi:MAG: ABC transporter substrate-binding protein, partial [Propionibacteriales bacterium]|nr:ABC transporter substrate-binding protein [Propionibacteriales bacterium]
MATVAVVGAGCSNDTAGGDKGSVDLSGQNFTEMQIMAEMYSQLLENEGYSVSTKLVDTRDVYIKELQSGGVDVAPEYVGALADFLNVTQNGEDAETVTSPDPTESLNALEPLADKANITLLEPADASDQNAFAVTQEFAKQNDLATLSDLGALGQPIVLAAAPDCEGRTDCEAGLTAEYGIDITKVLPLGYGSPQAIDSVKNGESQLAEVATTQSNVTAEGLVILEDDKQVQPAQNLIPAMNSDFLQDNPDAADALNKLADTLTTDDLTELNTKVDLEREDPADVAKQYLEDNGLL